MDRIRTWSWKSATPTTAQLPSRTWEPAALRPGYISLVVIQHALLIAVIAALVGATHRLDGFAEIQEDDNLSSVFRSIGTDMNILWTAIPPFIFQIFVLCRNWVLDDAVVREPFAELGVVARESRPDIGSGYSNPLPRHQRHWMGLRRRGQGNGQASVLRDYRTEAIATRWLSTSKDGHWHLTIGILLSISFNLFLIPLAASMLHVQTVTKTESIQVAHGLVYNEEFAGAPLTQWGLVLDAVTSEVIYNGRHLPWTNASHAFQPFQPLQPLPDAPRARVTAPSVAYTGDLNCVAIRPSGYTVEYEASANSPSAMLTINATDRGCSLRHYFSIFGTTPLMDRKLYFETVYERACSLNAYLTRMYFIAATTVGDVTPVVDQMHLFSCIPSYGRTPGNLTVLWTNDTSIAGDAPLNANQTKRLDTSLPPIFAEFSATGPADIAQVEHNDKFEYGILTTTKLQGVSGTQFGNLVIQLALRHLPSDRRGAGDDAIREVLTRPEILIQAIPQTFAYVYRSAISQIGFISDVSTSAAPAASPRVTAAALSSPRTRLFVRYWIAAILLFFLVGSLASTVWLLLARRRRPQPLAEQPEGVLSYVGLLLHDTDKNIAAMVRDVTKSSDFDGKFVKRARERWTVDEATFFVTETGDHGSIALRAENLRPRQGLDSLSEQEFEENDPKKAGFIVSEKQNT